MSAYDPKKRALAGEPAIGGKWLEVFMSSTKIDVPAQTFKLGQGPTLSPESRHRVKLSQCPLLLAINVYTRTVQRQNKFKVSFMPNDSLWGRPTCAFSARKEDSRIVSPHDAIL